MTNSMRAYELVVKLALPSWRDMGDVTRTLNQNGHHRTHSDINVTNCGRRATSTDPSLRTGRLASRAHAALKRGAPASWYANPSGGGAPTGALTVSVDRAASRHRSVKQESASILERVSD